MAPVVQARLPGDLLPQGRSGASDVDLGVLAGERTLLQERLALFGKIGAVLSVVFYVVVNGLRQVGAPDPRGWLDAPNLVILAVVAQLALLHRLCRGRPRSLRALRVLDAGAVLALSLACGFYGWTGSGFPTFEVNALLAETNILIFRAILLPGSPRRTAVIGVLALLPAVAPAWVGWLSRDGGEAARLEAAFFTAWACVAASISTMVSVVIYGLRRSVEKALRLGQYVLEERIGEGAMGTVYRARHALLRRPTAIKLLRPELADGDTFALFEREARLTSALTHPNTVAIYDYGRTAEGIFYYAMELLPGKTLTSLVEERGPLPPGLIIHILSQVCDSLAEAHAAGLVHRDVKAANIMLCERGGIPDVVKVLDFGLVTPAARRGDGTAPGAVGGGDDPAPAWLASPCGTPEYLSPEAIRDPASVDARTDLYAVGVLGYMLATATHPFQRPTIAALLAAQILEPPEPPSVRVGRSFPPDLEALILRCMAKSPDDRPQSARVLRAALLSCRDAPEHREGERSAPGGAPRSDPGGGPGPTAAPTLRYGG